MIDVRSLVRPHLLRLKPYVAARHDADAHGMLRLDANENAWGSDTPGVSRYPDPLQRRLKSIWGEVQGIDPARVFVGNGSDECIDLLIRAFCRPGQDRILITPPTYGMYATAAAINGVDVAEVPLGKDFGLDTPAVLRALEPSTRLVVLCSPNNPTGNLLAVSAIESILRSASGLVVLDEAYVDFCDAPSWTARLDEFDNLVVLQTLSKAWGLAGLRVGIACGGGPVIDILNRIKPPYNVSGPSQSMATEALSRRTDLEASRAAIMQERARLGERLQRLDGVLEVFPSDANFLLVRVREATRTYLDLRSRGVVVRDRSDLPGCEDCLRITVGRPEENDRLLAELGQRGGRP